MHIGLFLFFAKYHFVQNNGTIITDFKRILSLIYFYFFKGGWVVPSDRPLNFRYDLLSYLLSFSKEKNHKF